MDSTISVVGREFSEDYVGIERFLFPDAVYPSKTSATSDTSSDHFFWSIHPRDRLADKVDQLCRFARFAYDEIDTERLERAQNEANILVYSSVFSERTAPLVSIDPHGEISFTHKSPSGYLDIGVRGDGELSYHVRNDLKPENTVYDDVVWSDYGIPAELLSSVEELSEK